jgi:hypothetical protein
MSGCDNLRVTMIVVEPTAVRRLVDVDKLSRKSWFSSQAPQVRATFQNSNPEPN